MRTPLVYLASNLLSLIGAVLVTTAGILWLITLPAFWTGETGHPYLGIILDAALPALFVSGLALIPIGIWLNTRKRRKAGDMGPLLPRGGELRKLAIFLGLTTFVNVVIGSELTYSAVTYVDSTQFCGKACHTVMQPEYTAHENSPHANVDCVECHIGPGAPSFFRAKITGTQQLIEVVLHNYPTPVPAPVESLRPARETCGHCHEPRRFFGDVMLVRTHFAADETNTPATTVARMKVGGQTWRGNAGIHGAHVDDNAKIEYIATDKKRGVIPQVTYTAPDGKVTVFNATDAKPKPEELAAGEHRLMDCTDCHNRSTHIFWLPENAVDRALDDGRISPKLPFAKKTAVEALRRDYPSQPEAVREISSYITNFYRAKYPQSDPGLIHGAVTAAQAIYSQNVFPDMKVTWGSYPSHLGHTDSPGCFRCHDGNHTSADGRTISNDCATCHDLLAVEEKDPKILTDLGMRPAPVSPGGGASK